LNALEGYVPKDITKTLKAFLDFCYIARQNVLTEDSLNALDAALERFHHYREIFRTSGVRPDGFSLPRQHSLKHYRRHIENFGAPNGLCSSITESKHITAVKKPWRRSNRHEALKQMLTINTRNDKLAAARADFASRGMLQGTCLGEAIKLWQDDLGSDTSDDDEDQFGGPDGNGEDGDDLDINDDDDDDSNDDDNDDDGNDDDNDDDGNDDGNNNGNNDNDNDNDSNDDDGSPGPVDGPPTLSEVVLAQRKGIGCFITSAGWMLRDFAENST